MSHLRLAQAPPERQRAALLGIVRDSGWLMAALRAAPRPSDPALLAAPVEGAVDPATNPSATPAATDDDARHAAKIAAASGEPASSWG